MGLVWNPSRWKCPNNTQWKCPNRLLAEGAARAEEANRLDLFYSPSFLHRSKRSGLANSLERALRKSIAFPLLYLGESIDSYYAGKTTSLLNGFRSVTFY